MKGSTRRFLRVCIVVTVGLGVGCRGDSPDRDDSAGRGGSSSRQTSDVQLPGPVIAHLRTVDRLVTIYAGVTGPEFRVHTVEGEVVAKDLRTADFRARFPNLYDLYRASLATPAEVTPDGADDGGSLDASLLTPAADRPATEGIPIQR